MTLMTTTTTMGRHKWSTQSRRQVLLEQAAEEGAEGRGDSAYTEGRKNVRIGSCRETGWGTKRCTSRNCNPELERIIHFGIINKAVIAK